MLLKRPPLAMCDSHFDLNVRGGTSRRNYQWDGVRETDRKRNEVGAVRSSVVFVCVGGVVKWPIQLESGMYYLVHTAYGKM